MEGNLLRPAALWLGGCFFVMLALTHVVHPGFWNVSSWRAPKQQVRLVGPAASTAILTTIAARIADSPTTIRCVPNLNAGTGGDDGLGGPWGAKLDEQICVDLGYLPRVPAAQLRCAESDGGVCGGAIDEVLYAMHVLAHESMHIRGIRSEPVADCYGLQYVPVVAEGLGASANEARELGRYFAKNFVEIRRPPGDYRSPECHPGGALDLAPQTPSWPD